MIAIGDKGPAFTLPDTTGSDVAFPDGGGGTVVAFTCNHCPYALAWHERLLAVARDYADRGVRTVLVNPNDASSDGAPGPSRHVCTSPMNDSFGVCSVLPIGVLQHAAYHRTSPFDVSRMQASDSRPCVNVTFFGST